MPGHETPQLAPAGATPARCRSTKRPSLRPQAKKRIKRPPPGGLFHASNHVHGAVRGGASSNAMAFPVSGCRNATPADHSAIGVSASAASPYRRSPTSGIPRDANCTRIWCVRPVSSRTCISAYPARLTVESPVSLQQPESPPIQAYQELRQQEKVYVSAPPEQRLEMAGPAAAQGFALLDQLPAIWLTGVGCMALYMALSLLRMRWRLRAAPRIQDNVYRCTDWSTPFVLGVLAPRIYVPETVSEQDFPQVLAHERCHIRRWDHVWKPLAFLLLAVNWFNPVLWAAYVLLGRDMERACDEMVLKNADAAQRAAYSRALVACAAQPKMAAVCPLAFGEVAVKERVKNVLNYKKPALWAVILLVVAAAIIGACLLTKPGYKNVGTLDAEKLFALRTEYVGDNAAVSGILDALGLPEMGDTADSDTYAYSIRLDTNREPMGVTVCYAFAGDVPERSAEWNRQMAQRGYIAMALIDNIDWFRWTDIDQAGTSHVTGAVYSSNHAGYVDALSAARESVKGLQTYMDMLRTMAEDGSIVYYEGDAQPSFEETMPWSVTGDNDPCSVRAEDYGIVYNDTLPDWDTLPLSYLCAYYLNADGAYAEGAMDVLAQRYSQLPQQVRRYIGTLSGQADPRGNGDAAEALLRDISRYITSQLTGGLPVTVSYEKDQLSIAVTEVYSVVYRTVKYDENYSEDIPVYEVGSGAQLSVIKGEGFTLYGRYNEENVALHNGDVVELTEQFVGLGMDGQYAVRFQYRSAAETAEKTTLSFNDNGAGMVSYPAYVFRGSGYAITVLGNAWHQMTLSSGWTDICVDGSPAINGKPAEVWQSTEDINTQLAVVHLGAMTLKEAQEWSKGAAGDGFTLTESKQGDMSGDGKNGSTEMYWTCGFYGTGSDWLAVIKTYPVAQTEHLGYALNAMADTFTLT